MTCDLGPLANGGGATVTITVHAATAGVIANEAHVSANELDPDTSNNSTTVTTTVNPAADVRVAKSGAPNPVSLGGTLTYTIVVSNSGPSSATNVTLSDPLPGGVAFVSSSSTAGTCAVSKGKTATLSCAVGTLGQGTSATIAVVVKAPNKAGAISNTATARATETDPDTTNNSATTAVVVGGAADLGISKSASPNPVAAGGSLTYTMVVANAGPSDASGVTLTDPLPKGVTYVSSSASQGTCTASKVKGTVRLTCSLGSLVNGANAIVTLVVVPNVAGVVTNAASVASSVTDPNSGNNTATASVTVQ